MRMLHNYFNDLELRKEYQDKGYYKKSYILKCHDENNEQNYIDFSIYYSHCVYTIYVQGLKIEKIENGSVTSFTSSKDLVFGMVETTYRLSKKQIAHAEEFLKLNIYNILETYCDINKNIYID